jgi:uncharacterized protein (TIGR01777 family)
MKIVIAGGSGLLGSALTQRLVADGHVVTVLTRQPHGRGAASRVLRYVDWDPNGDAGPWAKVIDGADGVVNLAGAGIADKRWTNARKRVLRASRILSTRSLVAAVRQAENRPPVFVQGSAVGIYGTAHGDREIDESFPPGQDFFSDLGTAWEAEAQPVSALGSRLVVLRSGVVVAREGGAVKKLRLAFNLFGGGPIASGTQYMSWIHVDDWTALCVWALMVPTVSGVINATAPVPVTNEEFSAALGRALRRPSWLRMPAWALRVIVGEMADPALIEGLRVVPKRAEGLGFRFVYPKVDAALSAVVRG